MMEASAPTPAASVGRASCGDSRESAETWDLMDDLLAGIDGQCSPPSDDGHSEYSGAGLDDSQAYFNMSTCRETDAERPLPSEGEAAVGDALSPPHTMVSCADSSTTAPEETDTDSCGLCLPDTLSSATPFRHYLGGDEADSKFPQPLTPDGYAAGVRQASLSSAPSLRTSRTHRYLKLMVVGPAGIGKTTFIDALLEGVPGAPGAWARDAGVDAFKLMPHAFCAEVTLRDVLSRTATHFLVQDTPSLDAADPTALRAIADHIAAALDAHRALEDDPSRGQPMAALPDGRVDAVLYFVAPHCLADADVVAMAALSELAAVVPVLAKADTMTTSEVEAFQAAVTERLHEATAQLGRPIMYPFTCQEIAEAGGSRMVPPFAIANPGDQAGHHERHAAVAHLDLPVLRRLLLEVAHDQLKADTEAAYYSRRAQQDARPHQPPTGAGPPAASQTAPHVAAQQSDERVKPAARPTVLMQDEAQHANLVRSPQRSAVRRRRMRGDMAVSWIMLLVMASSVIFQVVYLTQMVSWASQESLRKEDSLRQEVAALRTQLQDERGARAAAEQALQELATRRAVPTLFQKPPPGLSFLDLITRDILSMHYAAWGLAPRTPREDTFCSSVRAAAGRARVHVKAVAAAGSAQVAAARTYVSQAKRSALASAAKAAGSAMQAITGTTLSLRQAATTLAASVQGAADRSAAGMRRTAAQSAQRVRQAAVWSAGHVITTAERACDKAARAVNGAGAGLVSTAQRSANQARGAAHAQALRLARAAVCATQAVSRATSRVQAGVSYGASAASCTAWQAAQRLSSCAASAASAGAARAAEHGRVAGARLAAGAVQARERLAKAVTVLQEPLPPSAAQRLRNLARGALFGALL